MPVVGEKRTKNMGRGYDKDPISRYAASFKTLVENVSAQSGLNLFTEATKALLDYNANEAIKNFFIENTIDRAEYEREGTGLTMEDYDDHMAMMEALYENDRDALLEYSSVGEMNPVIGMSIPIHKNILMNNIFDKGAIQKVVAREPKFTISLETRLLIDTEGNEIDMFYEQYKMTPAIDKTAPFKEIEIALPEAETTNILEEMGYTDEENLSIESGVSAVKTTIYLNAGDKNPETGVPAETSGEVECWVPYTRLFVPSYGEYDRTMTAQFKFENVDENGEDKTVKDVLTGYMKENKIMLTAGFNKITAVKFRGRIDTSSAMVPTCNVAWRVRTDIVEIPSAIPINVPISPEEVKDIGALYQVNQLSKIMSMMKLTLGNYKDDKIKENLDRSFLTMDPRSKSQSAFDFAPPADGHYAFDHIEWRNKTFMDFLDTQVTSLLQVLNDPNMTITVIGRPDLIRKITPTEYNYQTPSSIGPVELGFVKTVTTSDKRVYQFISSDKMRGNNNLIVILNPRNTERIMYRIYDYQFYVSNEIRNVKNYALPAVHAFERWKFVEYQPVQARIQILNPTGLRKQYNNDDPIGTFSMNDFDSNKPYVEPEEDVTP